MKNAFVKLFKNVPCILFYSFFALLVLGQNVIMIPSLFTYDGDSYIGNDGGYAIIMFMYVIEIFLMVSLLAPYQLKKQIDESDRLKRFIIGAPIFAVTMLQSGIYSLCALISKNFDVFPLLILLHGVLICILTYLFILVSVLLRKASGSMLWSWFGILTVIVSPILLSQFFCKLYGINTTAPQPNEDGIRYTLFFALIIVFVLTALIMGILKKCVKEDNAILFALTAVSKTIIAFLLSFTLAYLFMGSFAIENMLSFSYILWFSVISTAILTVLTLIIYLKHKPLLKIIISDVCAIIVIALVFTIIPTIANKKAEQLPKASQISEVDIFLDNDEYFTVKTHTKDVLEAHGYLLGLFKQGYTESAQSSFDDPTCIADLWDDFDVTYTLKGGRIFSREYRRLYDPAFDEFYIKLIQSDMYSYSLCNTEIYKPVLSYEFKTGELNSFGEQQILVKKCEPPEAVIQDLLETYCEELKNAERSAFYEGFDTLVLTNVYAYKDFKLAERNIYVPRSFTKTREKINSIITEQAQKK